MPNFIFNTCLLSIVLSLQIKHQLSAMAVENYFMSMGWSFLGVAFTLLLYRLIYVPFHMNQVN